MAQRASAGGTGAAVRLAAEFGAVTIVRGIICFFPLLSVRPPLLPFCHNPYPHSRILTCRSVCSSSPRSWSPASLSRPGPLWPLPASGPRPSRQPSPRPPSERRRSLDRPASPGHLLPAPSGERRPLRMTLTMSSTLTRSGPCTSAFTPLSLPRRPRLSLRAIKSALETGT